MTDAHSRPAGGFTLIDLGSRNGTYVNGERVTRTVLTEQDVVRIGDATCRCSGGELRPVEGESPGGGDTDRLA